MPFPLNEHKLFKRLSKITNYNNRISVDRWRSSYRIERDNPYLSFLHAFHTDRGERIGGGMKLYKEFYTLDDTLKIINTELQADFNQSDLL